MSLPRAVIFDMDGLMIDSERLYREAQVEITAAYDKAPPGNETLRRMMGQKPLDSIRILIRDLDLPASPEEILERRNRIMENKLRADLRVMPGLPEIMAALRGRFPLALATGSHRGFMELVLERLELRDDFQVLRCGDDVEKGKPDPEIYLKTAAALGLAPENCLVLEDSENGVNAAHAAGCPVWAIPSSYTREQDFSRASARLDSLRRASRRIDSLDNSAAF